MHTQSQRIVPFSARGGASEAAEALVAALAEQEPTVCVGQVTMTAVEGGIEGIAVVDLIPAAEPGGDVVEQLPPGSASLDLVDDLP